VEVRSFIEQLRGFGDRTAGGRGERTSQEALAGLLGRLGYQARVEGCVCHTNPGAVWLVHAVAMLVAALWSVTAPPAGLILALVTMLSLYGESWPRFRALRWLLPKGISSNLIAHRIRAEGDDEPRVLFVAHGDVARRGLIHNHLLGRPFRGVATRKKVHVARLVRAMGWLTVALIVARYPGVHEELLDRLLLVPLAFFGVMTALCLDWMRPRPAEGAHDNGSGLAVLAALAEHFAAAPPRGLEVCFLVTGAREANSRGMAAFLTTFGRTLPPKDTFVINLDDVGAGQICFAIGEKVPGPLPYHPLLPGLAAALSREEAFTRVEPVTLLGLGDAGVATRFGYAALTVKGLKNGQPASPVHTRRDRIRLLKRKSVTTAHDFSIALVERLSEQLQREKAPREENGPEDSDP